MKLRTLLSGWWKRQPSRLKKPLVFIIGLVLIIVSPLLGALPGPGGILVFLAGIAVLATEFDWAENLKAFVLTRVPAELQRRWRPTPRWQLIFDVTAICLLAVAALLWAKEVYLPVFSFGFASLSLFIFNRERLARFKKWLKRRQK